MNTLLIPLVGPMQSWGNRSRFDDRDTNIAPTKSGVLGMLCAALGRIREQDITDLVQMRFGVRIDSAGRPSTDFQTAQGVVRADGSGRTNVTSKRHYLSGSRFLAGIESEDIGELENIELALHSPKFTLSLGRKSYPLTLPPYLPNGSIRKGAPLEEALRREPWRRLSDREPKPPKLVLLIESTVGNIQMDDNPDSFEKRSYSSRYIFVEQMDTPQEVEEWCTFPN